MASWARGRVDPISPWARGGVGAWAQSDQGPTGGNHCVVLYLHSPREKHWGILLSMEPAGLWLKGIELESFESWAREQVSLEPGHMGLTTFFVPFLRVDKIVLDERVGAVPSLRERFEAITGKSVEAVTGDGG